MSNSFRLRLTLEEAMRFVGVEFASPQTRITYDPKLKRDYVIRRSMSHDGTWDHSIALMLHALKPLFGLNSYCKRYEPPAHPDEVDYIIGPIKVCGVYGEVDLPIGRYPGTRERVAIPVRCIITRGRRFA